MTMTIPARMNKDIALMKLRALSGDADAAWQCGYALLNGKYEHETRGIVFCREDKSEGLKWLKYAAEHGCAPAMLELGETKGGIVLGEESVEIWRIDVCIKYCRDILNVKAQQANCLLVA